MRLLRTFAALLLGLPMATPIPVAAEDAPLAPEVQRRVAVVVLARRIRGYAAMAKASSDCQVDKGVSLFAWLAKPWRFRSRSWALAGAC